MCVSIRLEFTRISQMHVKMNNTIEHPNLVPHNAKGSIVYIKVAPSFALTLSLCLPFVLLVFLSLFLLSISVSFSFSFSLNSRILCVFVCFYMCLVLFAGRCFLILCRIEYASVLFRINTHTHTFPMLFFHWIELSCVIFIYLFFVR